MDIPEFGLSKQRDGYHLYSWFVYANDEPDESNYTVNCCPMCRRPLHRHPRRG